MEGHLYDHKTRGPQVIYSFPVHTHTHTPSVRNNNFKEPVPTRSPRFAMPVSTSPNQAKLVNDPTSKRKPSAEPSNISNSPNYPSIFSGFNPSCSACSKALSRVFADRGCERIGRLRLVVDTVQLEAHKSHKRGKQPGEKNKNQRESMSVCEHPIKHATASPQPLSENTCDPSSPAGLSYRSPMEALAEQVRHD